MDVEIDLPSTLGIADHLAELPKLPTSRPLFGASDPSTKKLAQLEGTLESMLSLELTPHDILAKWFSAIAQITKFESEGRHGLL